jgi:hypothetical protein
LKRSATTLGIAGVAVSALASSALLVTPATAATVSEPIATGLVGPLQMDVEGDRVVVAQNFIGVLSEVNADGSTDPLYQQKDGEVAGVAIHGDSVGFLTTKHTKKPASFLKLLDAEGSVTTIANLYKYEAEVNPDGDAKYGFRGLSKSCKQKLPNAPGVAPYTGIVDSHPYGLADAEDGTWYVADAAANAILSVTPEGDGSTVAVLPPQKLRDVTKAQAKATGLPGCVAGHTFNFEPVPTDVEIDDAGQLVVSLLPGGPEDPSLGARGSVVRIDPATGARTPVASGFAGATNVAVNGDTIYVSELFGGKVTAIAADGATSTFYEAKQPAAIEWANGKLYVAIKAMNQKTGGSIVTVTPDTVPAT